MTVLVTGATGFVGQHLVDELSSSAHQIRALIRNADKAESLMNRGIEVCVGDIRDENLVSEAAKGVEVIYHCAAASSMCPEEEIQETNLGGVRAVLDAALEHHTSRVIQISSINVFGNGSFENATEETSTRRSNEIHADVKIEGEELIERYRKHHGLDVMVLRPGLIYGPGQPHLAKLASAVQRGKFAFIGSRDNLVPLVFVSDMVQAMILAARTDVTGRTYNITDGSRATIADLVYSLADLLECPRPTKKLPYWLPRLACTLLGMLRIKGPINRTTLRFLGTSRHISVERALKELGYNPQVDLRTGIGHSLEWLRAATHNVALTTSDRSVSPVAR